MPKLVKKIGPLYTNTRFKDTKDPCPVFDGKVWHIFGSGGSVREEKWKILHAIAPALEGPWIEDVPVELNGMTGNCDHVAAPGVIYDKKSNCFHMFLQTDFMDTNGRVEYLRGTDYHTFTKINTALSPLPNTEEAGIYDPHPTLINGKKYLVYSGMSRAEVDGKVVIRPDVFLAKSKTNTWDGPWERLGKILDHRSIAEHHNQPESPNYEWGIEGPQLIELPDKRVLLNATCFLPEGRFGTRQRTFFALADDVCGPYKTLGPIIVEQLESWESGENGHAAGFVEGEKLHLFYQARSKENEDDATANDWRFGIATFDLSTILQKKKGTLEFLLKPKLIWKTIYPHGVLAKLQEFITGQTLQN